ncbi:hypothetical protein EGW08_001486 [Elysia chlorotica]|uniref:Uncharacterized protein n=1 Tax=Elysia chlorotica TaxID=188477 RepID=A0A3S0ZZR1_ELYCH|nr:hypothetical protein EGW08_001486 [Elysia chlorotica]
MDLAKITVPTEESIEQQVLKISTDRPKSATQKAVEDKVFSLISYRPSLEDTGEEEEPAPSEADSGSDFYENYFFEEENFEDYLKLGPLELKLLSVTGQQMPIHEMEEPSQEEVESKAWNPDEWPVTCGMLKGPLMFNVKS